MVGHFGGLCQWADMMTEGCSGDTGGLEPARESAAGGTNLEAGRPIEDAIEIAVLQQEILVARTTALLVDGHLGDGR